MGRVGQGVFVTVEGGEGVGKSLFIQNLAGLLQSAGVDVVTTREPGGTPTAERLRQVFALPPGSDPLTPEAELFILSAARAQHVKHLITPALAAGRWVLCDRFTDSTRAYQGVLGGLATSLLEPVLTASTYGLSPQLTFLLDCDPLLAQSRMAQRRPAQAPADTAPQGFSDEVQRYDNAALSFHTELRAAYRKLAGQDSQRIVTLDAAQAPAAVAASALALLKERFSFAASEKTGPC